MREHYSFDSLESGRFTARAVGDLDGDSVLSTFEIAGQLLPDGGIVVSPLRAIQPEE